MNKEGSKEGKESHIPSSGDCLKSLKYKEPEHHSTLGHLTIGC